MYHHSRDSVHTYLSVTRSCFWLYYFCLLVRKIHPRRTLRHCCRQNSFLCVADNFRSYQFLHNFWLNVINKYFKELGVVQRTIDFIFQCGVNGSLVRQCWVGTKFMNGTQWMRLLLSNRLPSQDRQFYYTGKTEWTYVWTSHLWHRLFGMFSCHGQSVIISFPR